jgi:hypothetical protein
MKTQEGSLHQFSSGKNKEGTGYKRGMKASIPTYGSRIVVYSSFPAVSRTKISMYKFEEYSRFLKNFFFFEKFVIYKLTIKQNCYIIIYDLLPVRIFQCRI